MADQEPCLHNNGGYRMNIDLNPNTRAALYTNCTNCHAQIHGSDVPSPASPNNGDHGPAKFLNHSIHQESQSN